MVSKSFLNSLYSVVYWNTLPLLKPPIHEGGLGWSAVFDLSLIFDLSSIFPMEKSHLSRNLDLSQKQHSTPDLCILRRLF